MISWNEAAEEDVPEEQEVSQSTRLQAQKVFKNEHILDFFRKMSNLIAHKILYGRGMDVPK